MERVSLLSGRQDTRHNVAQHNVLLSISIKSHLAACHNTEGRCANGTARLYVTQT
jgi:hypothetical protein